MANLIPARVRWLIDVILFPGNVVRNPAVSNRSSLIARIKVFLRLTVFFIVNIVLYALPLSLAGIALGVSEREPLTLIVEIVDALPESSLITASGASNVLLRLANNSISLIVFAFLSFLMYHIGIFFTRKSDGAILSYYTIMISTSIYLAILFNISWYMVAQTETARYLIDWAVRQFFISSANLINVEPTVSAGEFQNLSALSTEGQIGFILLAVFLCYYIYVLYVGARSLHELTRYESITVVGFVSTSPVVFGTASALVSNLFKLPGVLTI